MRKGFILPVTLVITFFLGVLVSTTLLRAQKELNFADQRVDVSYAFYSAEIGIEKAIFELRRDSAWVAGFGDASNPVQVTLSDNTVIGEYWVDPANDILPVAVGSWPTAVWVQAWGRNAATPKLTRRLAALIAVQAPTAFFTSTPGDLRIGNGAMIGGDILGMDVIFENSEPVTVNGNVWYMRNLSGVDATVTITGAVAQSQRISFASLDLSYYKGLAQAGVGAGYYNGNQTFSGTLDNNILNSNGLIYVEGDVHIDGTVDKDFLIVATGNIYIDGDLTCSSAGTENYQIGLIAAQDVIVASGAPDTINIEAFVMADGGIFEAEGNPGEKSTLDFTGSISVRGKSTSSTGVNLNVYQNRNYGYNIDLSSNRRIPYMPFLVSVLRWVELPLDTTNCPFTEASLNAYISPLQ